ncbi:MAG: glutaredoxin [Actinomycetota bacterium]|nr:glutaredoxin [Actinomycetota bacterium]
MRTVKVYTKEDCKFSAAVKYLLDSREIPYEEIQLTPDSDEHKELGERTGSMKLPQAFIGVIPLGSNEAIFAADQSGMLAELLED